VGNWRALAVRLTEETVEFIVYRGWCAFSQYGPPTFGENLRIDYCA
jgi:hypothetical protein